MLSKQTEWEPPFAVQGFSDSCKYHWLAFEAPIPGLPKKSKASKELKGKNDLIGELLSISGWTKFLRRLDALDAHFRDRVSEYDNIWKKSKASKELKGKNDLIGQLLSISGWTEFLRRLDALDTHFRHRVSEYDKIWKKSKGSKDSQTPANIFDGLLKPRLAVNQKV